jgi:hypothetical protein
MKHEVCECRREDWVCEFGYIEKMQGGDCTPMNEKYYHYKK